MAGQHVKAFGDGGAVGLILEVEFEEEAGLPRIERDLMGLFPSSEWVALGHRLIVHGRRVCTARKPACEGCPLPCPSRQAAQV